MTSLFLLPLRLFFRLPFRLILEVKLIVLALFAGMAIAYGRQLRIDHSTWGLVRADTERELPGDDLVSAPDVRETRSLEIDASPEEVWPWIVQMGYGRGGWYSYDKLDRPWSPRGGQPGASSDRILPEFQSLAVGDVVPTHPGGGFEARVVEPARALVLYLDAAMVKQQLAELAADADEADTSAAAGGDAADAGFGADLGDFEMPDFRVSWAFVLEPDGASRTRLISRFRIEADQEGLPQRVGMPFIGYGIFAMTRKQMVGIKERAEASIARAVA